MIAASCLELRSLQVQHRLQPLRSFLRDFKHFFFCATLLALLESFEDSFCIQLLFFSSTRYVEISALSFYPDLVRSHQKSFSWFLFQDLVFGLTFA